MNRLPIEKNEELELTIHSVTLEGAGVGRVDGFAVFVPGTLVGERVRVHIIKVTASYAVGKLLDVMAPSPHRVEPSCLVYARCGGCAFGHVSYEEELRIKEQQVAEAMTRLGGLQNVPLRPILGMDAPERYRNKGAFPYGMTDKGPSFGFYAPRSHRLVAVDDCLIEQKQVCDAVNAVKIWAERYAIQPYDEGTGKGCLRHAVARVTTAGELMIVIVTRGELPHKKELVDALSFADSVYWNQNDRNTNVIFSDSFTILSGKPTLRETLCGLDFEVSPRSFLQVNPVQTQKLYGAALELLSPQPTETVADVYCGIGTITAQAGGGWPNHRLSHRGPAPQGLRPPGHRRHPCLRRPAHGLRLLQPRHLGPGREAPHRRRLHRPSRPARGYVPPLRACRISLLADASLTHPCTL